MLHLRATLSKDSSAAWQTRNSAAVNDERDLIQVISERHAADRRLQKAERHQALAGPLSQGEEVLLQRIRDRLDRSGYQWPGVEVTYHNVSVERRAVSTEDSLPSLFGPITSMLKRSTHSTIKALDNATGVLKPGSMTLLLGPPGSGRSTYLKVLSGRLRQSKMVDVQGAASIRYNGQPSEKFVMRRTAAYVDQVDKLLPTLTCRETLNFSETCAGEHDHLHAAVATMMTWEAAHPDLASRIDLDDEVDKLMLRMLHSSNLLQTEYMLAVLGLQHAANTLVGDAVLRGVSGGEKRRVGVGEMLVTTAMVIMLDEASTGLDSASTLALCQSMRRSAKLLNTTVVMALLQPEPAVVDLFDDIVLLAEGKVLWHGPTHKVLDHFAACGLRPLPGQEVAEFLTQLSSPVDQPALLTSPSSGGQLSASHLAKQFWESQQGVELKAAAEVDMTPNKLQLLSLDTRKQAAPWPVLLRACTKRLFKVEFARNWLACAIRWAVALFMAVVTGTLFLQLPVSFTGGVSLLGMLFQSLFFMQVLSVPTIELTFEKRPILFRQRDELFYPAWVEWLPATLLNVPILVVDSLLYGTVVYFMIGLTATAAAYFTFVLVLFCFSLLCDNLYRVYGGASKVLSVAIGIGVCHGLINQMLAGFVILPNSIPSYWYWLYWLNPLAYAFRSLAVNEFSQSRWTVPAGGPTTAAGSMSLGGTILHFFQIDSVPGASTTSGIWVWGGVGVLAGMAAFCAGLALLGYKYNQLKQSPAVLMGQQEEEDEKLRQQLSKKLQKGKSSAADGQQQQREVMLKVMNGGAGQEDDTCAIDVQDTSCSPATAARPLQGVVISFQELCYYVPNPAGGKAELQLLHNITGAFKPGNLTALMGSSGAGKTTLMDVIAGRKTAGRITGTLRVDGHTREEVAFARLTGYVEQTDIHVPLATVREALAFSAQLRAPAGADREQLVAAVLDMVELTPLADRLVGIPGVDGLSTEQRKRLTIAVELVTSPRALFLDEPTSGLGTRAAAVIAGVMRQISSKGVTVVATIHQPSQAIFRQFDELLLLQRGGRVVFSGELGPGAANLLEHFSAVPGAPAYQPGANPAAWMLDVVSGPQAVLPGYTDLAAYYQTSKSAKVACSEAAELSVPRDTDSSKLSVQQLNPAAPANSFQQLRLLLQRNTRSYWRNPATNFSRYIVTVAISLIVGSIEWGKGDAGKIHNAQGVQNCLGALYMVASALAVMVGFDCQAGLSKERVVYYRERAAGSYGAAVYLFAQALTEIVYVTAQVVLYTVITYFMVGFRLEASRFFYVLLLTWLNCVVNFLTSQALVHTTPVIFIATTLYSVLNNLQGLTSGYTRPLPSTPPAWWGAYFLNPSFYTFIGLGSAFLGDVSTTIPNPAAGNGAPESIAVSEYVLQLYRMGNGVFPGAMGSLGMLVVFSGVLLGVAFCGLKFARFQSR